MAPSVIDPIYENASTKDLRPSMYLLDYYAPEVVSHCRTLFRTVTCDDDEIHNWRENADAALARETPITAEDVARARKLLACGKQGVGLDNIDQEACKIRGIKVCNTPGMNAQAVAELVMCLSLSVARQVGSINARLARGETVLRTDCLGKTLHQKTIGVVGMGAIGKTVAQMFRNALGCHIYAYDPYMSPLAWSEIPHVRVTKVNDMLPHVDVLTLHVPLNSSTRGLISYAEMQKMKPDAILINAARGGIVNEDDLKRALDDGLLWGAALDCHEQEPPTPVRYKDLWASGRVISTPHVGATVDGLQARMAIGVIDNIYNSLHPSQEVRHQI